MRTVRLSITWLVVLAVLWFFGAGRRSTERVITGDVVEWQEGASITVVNEQTDPGGVRMDARAMDHDYDRDAIRTGDRVAVSYRIAGERYPVAVRLRVLDRQ